MTPLIRVLYIVLPVGRIMLCSVTNFYLLHTTFYNNRKWIEVIIYNVFA